jgi:hypothetical protein
MVKHLVVEKYTIKTNWIGGLHNLAGLLFNPYPRNEDTSSVGWSLCHIPLHPFTKRIRCPQIRPPTFGA